MSDSESETSGARAEPRLGVLAFGDSITHGGGELQWGVALQSWALWVARGLGVPFTSFAVDGARATDVVAGQIPAFLARSAHPQARYDVGCLYVGVNDVRAPDWDPIAFGADFRIALGFLAQRCDRLLGVTAPVGLGLPRAPIEVLELDEIVQSITHELGGLLVDLRSLQARNLVMADRVHPTAFGQLWIAERALAVLERDGLASRVAPASLISFQTTRWGRLRGDVTYAYRSLKHHARHLASVANLHWPAANSNADVHVPVFTPRAEPDTFGAMSTHATESPTGPPSPSSSPDLTQRAPRRIVIQYPEPSVDGGRYPCKRCVGDHVTVSVDVFRDGHDLIRAVVRYRGPGESQWREAELHRIDAHLDGVRWAAGFEVDRPGRWRYTIEAWTDTFGTWSDELARKVAAGQHDLTSELSEGIVLLRRAAEQTRSQDTRALIGHACRELDDPAVPDSAKHDVALGPELSAAVERGEHRPDKVTLDEPRTIDVDRLRARFGSWYELFPRSWGGLQGVQSQLPTLAQLGFDVVYLPPIHPIGLTNRKGADNALTAGPGDPGSPWAIGDATGGHDTVHPELGTIDDVKALTRAAAELGIDIAMDYAIQCSADHPWLTEHPEWFHRRPDGTLKYAENPPKRYQDIYNVNWESADWRALWDALLGVMLQWVDCGVKVFRVDNPHTKPFAFWAWLIDEVHARDRDVVFLAEAFTRRAIMRHLGKLGFSQSYTYFTWKNARWELIEYVSELAYSGEQEYFRPNFFANTPDILHEYLQHGGPPAFEARLVLAATLSPSYGIYSGYESFENEPVRAGSEEYLHSEKYEAKARALDGPLLAMISRLNHLRRRSAPLQELSNVTFLDTANGSLIAYAKRSGNETVICVVNLDPSGPQEGVAVIPASLGLAPTFTVCDQLTHERFQWHIGHNYVGFVPGVRQAHVLEVERPG